MRTSLPILLLALSFHAQAGDMYRWVDEHGRTHFSDTVPEKYKHSAKRSDSRQYEVSEADRKAAAERARQVKEHPVLRKTEESQTATFAEPSPKPVKANDCDSMRAAYYESQACFAPYRNANGSIKAEAFQQCQEVPDPSFKCGAPSHR